MTTLLLFVADLVDALRFLTRLPLPPARYLRSPGAVLATFPLAGAVLGVVLVGLGAVLGQSPLPRLTQDIGLVLALVGLTGGLHLDGLMDTCDGLGGGHSRERRLEIMRDSRVGSYGVLGGIATLLLKVGALNAVSLSLRDTALMLAPLLARWGLVCAAGLFPAARPEGLGAAFKAGATRERMRIALISSLLLAALFGGVGLLVWGTVTLTSWLLGRALTRRLGGLTGDCYGALTEVGEIVALFTVAFVM